jgi:hypothetical protein
MSSNNQSGLFFIGLFIAVGLALGGYFIGQTMYNAKIALNTAEAKGLAERRVKADRANWDIIHTVKGSKKEEIPNLYNQAEMHQETIINLLKEHGFEDNEIEVGVLDYHYHEFRDEDQKMVDQTHKLIGTISVETKKVEKVGQVRTAVSKLIAQGIDIENRAPNYRFTKLN